MKTPLSAIVNTIFIIAMVAPAYAGKSKFTDTSTGTADTPESLGGITDQEAAILDRGMNRSKVMQKKIQNFKGGRTSSGSGDGVESRYSGVLEMHDADHDGVTDHDGGANAMESASERHAAGKMGLRGADRLKAMEKVRTQACKNSRNKTVCDSSSSPSSVLLDRGAAHGTDTAAHVEVHRVYELDEKVQEDAKAAGKAYAAQAVFDASEATPDGVYTKKGSRKNLVRVKTADGDKEVAVGANLDLLRDEASKLEQIKQHRVNNTWKFLRGKRLAQAYIDSLPVPATVDKGKISAAVIGNPSDPNSFWHNSALSNLVESSYRDADSEQNVTAYDQKFSQGLQALVKQSLDKEIADSQASLTNQQKAQLATDMSANTQKLAKCMKSGVYCYGASSGTNQKDSRGNIIQATTNFMPVKAGVDPGGTFNDTREFMYERVDAANRGGMNNAVNSLRTLDLSENTDKLQKGKTKTYADLMQQAAANKKASDDFIASEKAKGQSSTIDMRQYNPNTMSAAQLSRRNLDRGDGSTLGGIGQGMGQQVMPGGQVSGSAYGSGAAPQRQRAPTGGVGIRN